MKAARSRYEGCTRNPWNEYECGNWYARAMASYALLGALSGFRYSAVERTLWFAPRLKARPFECFFSAASGSSLVITNDVLTMVGVVGANRTETIRDMPAGRLHMLVQLAVNGNAAGVPPLCAIE